MNWQTRRNWSLGGVVWLLVVLAIYGLVTWLG